MRDGCPSEGSLELPDRMRFFDGEPFSATLVRAGRTFETNHFTLRVVGIATPLLETSLKLDTTTNTLQLQNSPGHPHHTGVGCGTRFEGNKPERELTVQRSSDSASADSQHHLKLDDSLRPSLETVYDGRLDSVIQSLSDMGSRYYFRLNAATQSRAEVLENIRSKGLEVGVHEIIPEAAYLPVTEGTLSSDGTLVGADRFAAEAVMQGAHLYAPGVQNCKGLRAGMKATVEDRDGNLVGSGIARQGETSILRYHQGIAVETLDSRFRLPPLRETSWYNEGLIHLQSLPAMTTCTVLDPHPGEVIVDLNCSPAGKMSYLCQLTDNKATVIGFDRNTRKIEKAREHLERLHCKNYQLIAHDSRYAHLDFTLRADKVLVDAPCTGLGVMPKLSIDTTMTDVECLAAYQKQFLRTAASIVKRGGTIVYSVCTITGEECEQMVKFAQDELGLIEQDAEPMVRTNASHSNGKSQRFDPELDGIGFFIAKLVKP